MTPKKSAIVGSTVAGIGLLLVLFTGYLLLALGAAGGLGPVEPEATLFPAGAAIIAALVVFSGFKLSREADWNIRTAISALAVFPAGIVLILACIQAAVAMGEPLYRENRKEAFDVLWKAHSQLADRVTVQLPGGEPIWLTLSKQDGLLEHLKQSGHERVKLNVLALVDRKGRVTRFYAKDLDGFKLKRQNYGGQYHPGSLLLKTLNSGSSNHLIDRPAAR
jgi:hypothetical protein